MPEYTVIYVMFPKDAAGNEIELQLSNKIRDPAIAMNIYNMGCHVLYSDGREAPLDDLEQDLQKTRGVNSVKAVATSREEAYDLGHVQFSC